MNKIHYTQKCILLVINVLYSNNTCEQHDIILSDLYVLYVVKDENLININIAINPLPANVENMVSSE